MGWNNRAIVLLFIGLFFLDAAVHAVTRGTGDLGIIIERGAGRVLLVETSGRTQLAEIGGLGDLSHASAVFSRDGRYAYIFGRDGGLTKVDLLEQKIARRIIQAGNSIGGAISQDGKLIAASNYDPGGVRIFDAGTLEPVADIPAAYGADQTRSKTVGLVDAPGQRFIFSLYDAGEIWILDMSDNAGPQVTRLKEIGRQPYDALITPDGRFYIAGLFGEDGLALVDLWEPAVTARQILQGYRRGAEKLPVYKMPHLEGWAVAGDYLFVPAVGEHAVLVVDRKSWREIKRIPVKGQPVFTIARPDGRQVWVNFALPANEFIQVIDTASLEIIQELEPGKGVLHMEFTPRGEEVWVSVRDQNLVKIYKTRDFAQITELPADSPSGIFFTARANRMGL